jgi:phospholipase/lecithinase/hemolysin
LSASFNQGLRDGLAGQPVRLVDMRAFISDVVARPAPHGIANTSVPACDAARMAAITGGAVTDGSALFCNATPGAPYNGLRAGADVDSWFFADGNHPTTGGYRLISDEVLRLMRLWGWLRTDDLQRSL